ncbi:hypothetical protein [Micromonospora fulviviridis]|uniref:Ribbon-helix-helix protein, CopG family n=1 Tax=Micromonospora fulviviridis TaxID=47860 RepID=A0ABV2VS36_9ACTN
MTRSPRASDEPPMPPRRQAQPRVQISTRIPEELSERLRAFVRKHDTSVQAVVELALDEFLSRREA